MRWYDVGWKLGDKGKIERLKRIKNWKDLNEDSFYGEAAFLGELGFGLNLVRCFFDGLRGRELGIKFYQKGYVLYNLTGLDIYRELKNIGK